MNRSALLVIDLQNDMIHPDGKLAGCAKMVAEIHLIEKANTAIRSARKNGWPIIFIRVGFSADYAECPTTSPLFSLCPASPSAAIEHLGSGIPIAI